MTDDLEQAPPVRLDIPVCRALPRASELRADGEDGSPGTLVGNFSLFDEWYEIASWWEGNFIERIAAGAFKRTINNRSGETPVRVLLEHGFDPTVGDKPLGTPEILEERTEGPYAETPLFDTSYNRDLAPALAGGAYGQSFRFQVLRDEWVEEPDISEHNPKGIPERTITEVRLIEFGPTVFPASPATNSTTGLRSTTDAFYASVQRRDPTRYADALQNVRSSRTSGAPAGPAPTRAPADTGTPAEDPQRTEHSEDPSGATRAGHSEDSPAEHSTDPSKPTHPTSERESTTMDENMTVEERTARLSEIRARFSEIDTDHSGGELPGDVQAEWDELRTEFDTHERAIAAQEARRADIAERASNDDATETPSVQRAAARPGVSRGAPGTSRRPENIFDLSELRQRARSIDELPALMRDNAMRAVELASFPGAEDRSAAQAKVERLLNSVDDDKGTLARKILATGSPIYDRAFGKAALSGSTQSLTAEEQRALSLGVDTEGGFAVPFQLDPTIMLTSDGVVDPIREIARVEQIVGKEWQGITSAGVTVSRKAEKAESGDNAPAIAQPVVRTSRVDGFIPFSVELEQDWSQMKSELTMLLADGKATEEGDSFINGDGSANAGTGTEPGGLLTLAAGSIVETETANVYASSDLYRLEEALPSRFRRNASFLAERSFYNRSRQLGSDSDGGDLWVRLANGLPPELIGYAAREASEMPGFATTDDAKLAVLGDFRNFIIVDRVGMNVELVPHLFGANRRPTGMRGIWTWWRNGSDVLVDNAFRLLAVKPVV